MTDKRRLRYNGKNRENAFINYRIKEELVYGSKKSSYYRYCRICGESFS